MRHEPIADRARGRWSGILSSLGVSSRVLDGKHHGCPICNEGKDRFRFDDREGNGTFICTHCGAGNGVKFVMLLKRCDFRAAVKEIEGVIGAAPLIEPRKRRSDEESRAAMNRLWLASKPVQKNDIADRYLSARGVGMDAYPGCLRLCERAYYRDESPSWHPALLAMIVTADGRPVNIHRTYLASGGRKAAVPSPRKIMAGVLPKGCAIRLAPVGERLGIAEGIETALSASMLFGVPCWAAGNSTILEAWMPPRGVEEVLIFADHDKGFGGQKAAYSLAYRLAGKMKVSVHVPDAIGLDWNDVLLRQKKEAA